MSQVQTIAHALDMAFDDHGQLIVVDANQQLSIYSSDGQLMDQFKLDHTAKVNCLEVCGDSIVTGSDDHAVKMWSLAGKSFVKTLVRSTLPIRYIAVKPPTARSVAVVSDDLDIKLISTVDVTDIQILNGHKKAIITTSMDPCGDYMLTASLDGQICIWDLVDYPATCTQMLNDLIEKNSVFFNVSWNKKKELLAFPGKNKEIVVMEKESWQVLYRMRNEKLGEVKYVTWSPDGQLLAAADTKEQIFIWDTAVSRHEPVDRIKCGSAIKSLLWDIRSTYVWALDTLGNVFKHKISPKPNGNLARENSNPPKHTSLKGKNDSDDIEQDKEMIHFSDDEAIADDFVVDDDGAGYAAELLHDSQFRKYEERQRLAVSSGSASKMKRHAYTHDEADYESTGFDIQPPIQSGSTPMKNNRKYLAFNMLGYVHSFEQSSHTSVFIEFHDKSIRPFSFTDNYNYTISCLGDEGALFASESSHSSASMVYYRPFDNNHRGEWMVELDQMENAKVLALTNKFAVAGTDHRYLRFFSLTGIQRTMMSIPGPLVALTGWQDKIFVVYHQGGAFHGDQSMCYVVYDTVKGIVIQESGSIALSPGSTLEWICVDDNGTFATYDSCGVLRYLVRTSVWVPMLDTRKAKNNRSDTYWPVGLTDTHFMCVICKGGDKHPPFPKPLLHDIPFQVPFLNIENPQGQYEEKLMRMEWKNNHSLSEISVADKLKTDADMDKLTLQLILLACKAERSARAYELSRTLHLSKSLDGAMKLAVHHRMSTLAEKINQIKEERYRAEQEQARITTNRFKNSYTSDLKSKLSDDDSDIDVIANSSSKKATKQMKPIEQDSVKESDTTTTNSTNSLRQIKKEMSPVSLAASNTDDHVNVKSETAVRKPKNPFLVADENKSGELSADNRVGVSLVQIIKEKSTPKGTTGIKENEDKVLSSNNTKRKAQTTLANFAFKAKDTEKKVKMDDDSVDNDLIGNKENSLSEETM